MPTENRDEHVRAVWQSQQTESSFKPDELRRKVEQMERRMRRSRYDLYVALVLSSVVVVGLAVLFANSLLITGAAAILCGFAFLLHEVLDHRAHAPAADDGVPTSLEYLRALLQHRLEFHRRRLWLRVLILAPGGLLFFSGLAVARPDLTRIASIQLVTFVVAILLIVPANRRAAAALERRIHELEQLRELP